MDDPDDPSNASREADEFRFERDRHEVQTVEECPVPGCGAAFLGMTPDDVRDHLVTDHGVSLGQSIVFPTDEAKQRHDRFVASDADRGTDA